MKFAVTPSVFTPFDGAPGEPTVYLSRNGHGPAVITEVPQSPMINFHEQKRGNMRRRGYLWQTVRT